MSILLLLLLANQVSCKNLDIIEVSIHYSLKQLDFDKTHICFEFFGTWELDFKDKPEFNKVKSPWSLFSILENGVTREVDLSDLNEKFSCTKALSKEKSESFQLVQVSIVAFNWIGKEAFVLLSIVVFQMENGKLYGRVEGGPDFFILMMLDEEGHVRSFKKFVC